MCLKTCSSVFTSFNYFKFSRRLGEGLTIKCVVNLVTLLHIKKRALTGIYSDLTRTEIFCLLSSINSHETHDLNFTDIFDFTWILIKNIVIRTCSHENIPTQKIPNGDVPFYFDRTLFYVTYLTGGEKYVQWKQRKKLPQIPSRP